MRADLARAVGERLSARNVNAYVTRAIILPSRKKENCITIFSRFFCRSLPLTLESLERFVTKIKLPDQLDVRQNGRLFIYADKTPEGGS